MDMVYITYQYLYIFVYREMDMSEISWIIRMCTSWMCITEEYIHMTDLPSVRICHANCDFLFGFSLTSKHFYPYEFMLFNDRCHKKES